MTDLSNQRCKPCTGATPALSVERVTELLRDVAGYAYESATKSIARTYPFENYYQTLAFVNAVAWIAHTEDHHPDLEVFYNRAVVRWSTHAIKGISENDLICAAKVNRVFEP